MAHSMHDASFMNQRFLQDEGRTGLLSHSFGSVGQQHTSNDCTDRYTKRTLIHRPQQYEKYCGVHIQDRSSNK